MKLLSFNGSIAVIAAVTTLTGVHAANIERPNVQLIDKHSVNVATGQVTQGVTTLSIGGAMGLSHSISVYANEFAFLHNFGFNDKFWAETRYLHISNMAGHPIPNVFHVSDFSDSADFRAYVNGSPVLDFASTPPPYTYAPIGDERHSLVSINDELIWTKPDGTIVKYYRAPNASAGATGLMKEIIYPSGFTISIAVLGLQSVNTNTGFQLKYLYEADNRPMEKADKPNLVNAPPLATSFQSGWSNRNPKYIKAINNAIEYCAPSATTCSLANSWPIVTFDWPAGMPRTMFIGDSEARVTNPAGAIAKFRFRAYDLVIGDPNSPPAYPLDTWFSPRLVGVTPFGSTSEAYGYDFKNVFNSDSSLFGSWSWRAQTAGAVTTARYMDKTIGYTLLQPYTFGSYFNLGIGGGVDRVLVTPLAAYGNPNMIAYADTNEGRVHFESSARNFPYRFDKLTGPSEDYEYTRGNLTKVKVRIDSVWTVHREAGYPATCTPATQKTCNQADWIKDARGNYTYYTYHAPSGNIASITHPPNKNGFAAQTRYEYAQKSAQFYNGGSGKVAGTPIWLRTAEKSCINSNYAGGACGAGDEVVTLYEYNHDNLLLTGVTVTAPAGGGTLRTCFKYDSYGSQIGKTQPNANLSSCN
jgi:hypothetical protein